MVSETITALWLHAFRSKPVSEEGISSHASFDELVPRPKNATEFNLCEPQQPIPIPAGHISMIPQPGLSLVPTIARVCMRPEASGRTQASKVSSLDMPKESPWEITPALTPSKRTAFIPSSPRRRDSRASTCFSMSNSSSTVSSTSEATGTRDPAMSDFSNPRGCGSCAYFIASSNRRRPSPGSAIRLCVDICDFRRASSMPNVSTSVPSTARSLRLFAMLRREPMTLRLHACHSGMVPIQGRSSPSVRKMFPTTRPM